MYRLVTCSLILLLFIFFISCEDKTSEDLQNNLQVVGDMLSGQVYYWDVYVDLDKVARDSSLWSAGNARIDSAYCQVLPDDGGILLNYGSENVLCPDGRTRKGRVLLELLTPYFGDTLAGTVSFDDYYVDDHRLSGVIRLSGSSISESQRKVTLEVKEGLITFEEEQVIWTATQYIRWVEGMDTPYNTSDDRCLVLKDSRISGTASNLIGFTANVRDTLYWTSDCKYVSKGILDLSLPALEFQEGTVDFGEGNCDTKADLSFAGSVIPFYFE